jgi:RNA polymerase sigma-70 factor (ECF subfamily)
MLIEEKRQPQARKGGHSLMSVANILDPKADTPGNDQDSSKYGPTAPCRKSEKAGRKSWRDEHSLIQRAMDGDSEAQDQLFACYRSRLYRLALRLLRRREEAEDAVQDGLLLAYKNLASFQGRSLFSTWLTRIVVNAALVRMRRQRARSEFFLPETTSEEHCPIRYVVDSHPDPEQACAYSEARRLVTGALAELSPSIRSAFQLRELQDLSNSEAAEISGVQVGAFKSRISRARSQLAERLSPETLAPLQKPLSIPISVLHPAKRPELRQAHAG